MFSNDILIQFGKSSIVTDISITFPQTFTSTKYSVLTNYEVDTYNASAAFYTYYTSFIWNATGHKKQKGSCEIRYPHSTSVTTTIVKWLAVGY